MGTSHVIPGGDLCITSERGLSPREAAQAHPDRRRRLYRAGVRPHLPRPGQSMCRWSIAATSRCAASTTTCATRCRESMKKRGLHVLLGCEFTKIEKRGDCLHAETNKGDVDRVRPDHAGHRPRAQHRRRCMSKRPAWSWASAARSRSIDYSRTTRAAHLCHRRRHRPGPADAGRDPRSDVLCRDRLQEQSDQAGPRAMCPARCSPRRRSAASA